MTLDRWIAAPLLGAAAIASTAMAATTPAQMLAGYAAEAGRAPDATRGQALFTTAHGREWSCASCHGKPPTAGGRHASTSKPIAPLAPAFDAGRFTDPAKTEKWFRRNCGDVLGRSCTPAEKADLLAWLISLQP